MKPSPRALLALLALAAISNSIAAPPANDGFTAATDLGSVAAITISGTNVEATREANEPIYSGSDQSVWYKWTALASGVKRVSLTSTSTTDFTNPGVTVFEGAAIDLLTAAALDKPASSVARFNAVAGRVYYFHVIDQSSAAGTFSLALAAGTLPAPPANDNFASATTLTPSLPRSVTGTFLDATVELREPNAYQEGPLGSIWYRWTPPAGTSWVGIDLAGAAPSSGFRLYTGSTLATLTEFSPGYVDYFFPQAIYQVTPSTTYYLQLFQYNVAQRSVTLNIRTEPAPASPPNNAFASRTALGSSANVTRDEQTSVDATTETGEPLPFPELTGTVWYSWTAPSTGAFKIATVGSAEHDTFLSCYTGNTLTGLNLLAYNDDIDADQGNYDSSLVISAVAGTIYQIQVGSAYGARDTFDLTIAPVDSDFLPFRITNLTVSPAAVDLSTGPATIVIDVTLSDLLEFDGDMQVNLTAPASIAPWGGIPARRLLEGSTVPVLLAGLTYRVTRTLPAGLPPGSYPIVIGIDFQESGFANGRPDYGGRFGTALPGSVTAITVSNSGTPALLPTLTSFTMTPATVDSQSGDVTVLFSATAASLPTTNPINLLLTDSLGEPSAFSTQLDHNGSAWTGSVVIKKGTRGGVFRPTLTLAGAALGRDYGYANSLASALPAGSSSALTITNASPDVIPPQLKAMALDGNMVNLAAGDVLLTGTLRITDQSGLSSLSLGIDDGIRSTLLVSINALLSGSPQDGIYQWTILIPNSTPNGAYNVLVSMDDGTGNQIDALPAFGTWPVGLTASFTVQRSSADTAEIRWMNQQDFSALPPGENRTLTATAITADPDLDGLPNLLEFYFGTNPADAGNTVNAGKLPVVSLVAGHLRWEFGLSSSNAALGVPGSKLLAQYSTDLSIWQEVPVTTTAQGFRIESPAGIPAPGYLRLKAEVLPP